MVSNQKLAQIISRPLAKVLTTAVSEARQVQSFIVLGNREYKSSLMSVPQHPQKYFH